MLQSIRSLLEKLEQWIRQNGEHVEYLPIDPRKKREARAMVQFATKGIDRFANRPYPKFLEEFWFPFLGRFHDIDRIAFFVPEAQAQGKVLVLKAKVGPNITTRYNHVAAPEEHPPVEVWSTDQTILHTPTAHIGWDLHGILRDTDGTLLGILCFDDTERERAFDADEIREFEIIIESLCEQLRNKQIQDDLAYKDALTGAFNQKFLETLVDDPDLYANVYAIVYIDINNLKEVNDYGGHDAGNELLKGLYRIMRKHIRKNDRIIRKGGDEFIIAFEVEEALTEAMVSLRVESMRRDMNALMVEVLCRDADKFDNERESIVARGRNLSVTTLREEGKCFFTNFTISAGLSRVRDEKGKVRPYASVEASSDSAMYADKQAQKRRIPAA
jgi:diguanylate cyclase (GGDEF)-like protein